MDACRLGTLMRFKDMTEERLRFLKSIGLDCLQAAGLKDEFLTPEGEARAEQLLEMCSNAGLPAVSLFISFGELNLGAEEHSGIGFAPAATRGSAASWHAVKYSGRYAIISGSSSATPDPFRSTPKQIVKPLC